jgi:DNA-directed RNA polymerase II subunit RPB1
MSVANIYSERIYDEITLAPKLNAVNDPRMGTVVKDQACLTCFGDMVDCPGHFGHIELARPVYHVGLIDAVRKVLKVTCCNCSRLLIDDPEEKLIIGKIQYPKQRFFKILESVEKAFRRKCN